MKNDIEYFNENIKEENFNEMNYSDKNPKLNMYQNNYINNNNNNELNIVDTQKTSKDFVFVEKENLKSEVIDFENFNQLENEKRIKTPKEKMEYEYNRKVELRKKAFEYISNFQK